VVSELPTGCESNWRKFAEGVRNAEGDECPTFCYRVIVENCGTEPLINVTVTDPDLNFSGCGFPTMLAISQSYTCIVSGVEHCVGLTNTVTAVGTGEFSGITTNDMDTAAVDVKEISVVCEAAVNGSNSVTIPCDGQPYVITNEVEICNNGDLPILAVIDDASVFALLGDCTNWANVQIPLDPGQCTNIVLCIDAVTCPPECGIAWENNVVISATVDHSKTNVCADTRNNEGQLVEISTHTECSAVVECLPVPKAGCTPGFWKNCTIHWQLTGYRTDQTVGSVFSLGNCCTSLGNVNLLDALSFRGGSEVCGGARILLRAAVAALLNAASPEVDYPLTAEDVIASVNAALNSCDRGAMIALASELDRNNNLGCRDANGNELPCKRFAGVSRSLATDRIEKQ